MLDETRNNQLRNYHVEFKINGSNPGANQIVVVPNYSQQGKGMKMMSWIETKK